MCNTCWRKNSSCTVGWVDFFVSALDKLRAMLDCLMILLEFYTKMQFQTLRFQWRVGEKIVQTNFCKC